MKLILINFILLIPIILNYENDGKSQFNSLLKIKDKICLLMRMGEIKNKMVFEIDLQRPYSYVTSRTFLRRFYESSTSLGYFNNKSISNTSLEKLQDILHFNDNGIDLNKFDFYFMYENETTGYNSISFAYESKKEQNSIINILYAKKYIDKLQLILEIIGENGSLVAGSFPLNSLVNFTKGSCIIHNNKWGCDVNSIYVDKKKIYDNKIYTIFTVTSYEIVLPKLVYDYYIDNVINGLTKQGLCNEINGKYTCYSHGINKMPNITLEIGNMFYVLNSKNLFWQNENSYLFICQKNQNDNELQLGISFLEKFVSVFDYENDLIMFYSKDKSVIKEKNEFKLIDNKFYIIIVCIFLLFFNMIYNILILILCFKTNYLKI